MFWRGKKSKSKEVPSRQSTGAASRPVFSYYQNRVIPTNDSVDAANKREKRQISQVRKHHIPAAITLLVIVACFGYILTLSSRPRIVVINDQNRATKSLLRTEETYQQSTEEILRSSPFNSTKLSINTLSVSRAIQAKFPEISDVTVSLPLINRRPVVYLQITQPAFLLVKGAQVYALDDQGRVSMQGDASLQGSELLHIDDLTTQEAAIGSPFLPMSQIAFMQNVASQLQAKGVSKISFVLPPLANEVYVKIADRPYFVKMTFIGDSRLQSGTFLALKQKLEASKVTPAEYIDVRVEERAYYK